MSAIDEHPLRIARIRAGLTAERLGELSGVSRGTVNALEQGRIKTPRPELVAVLAEKNFVTPAALQGFYDRWLTAFEARSEGALSRVEGELSARARAVLALPPEVVGRYGSFGAWRRDVFPSVAGFASLLMLSATTLRRFEAGDISMPKPLIRALTRVLRLSDEYVGALMRLEGTDPLGAVREVNRRRKRVSRERELWRAEGDPRGGRDLRSPVSFVVAPVGVVEEGAGGREEGAAEAEVSAVVYSPGDDGVGLHGGAVGEGDEVVGGSADVPGGSDARFED